MTNQKITVCIPAHNEEKSLPRTLDSVKTAISNLDEHKADILVLANACSDNTITASLEWARLQGITGQHVNIDQTPDITIDSSNDSNETRMIVLETDFPGKPNAVNRLHQYANGEPLIFIDADITLHPTAFHELLSAMAANPQALAACGIVLAPPGISFNPLFIRMAIKMKEFASKPVPYVNGPLYAIRKNVGNDIPTDLIGEDVYLGMSLGVKRLVKVERAIAYQIPPNSFRDYYKRQIRNKLSDHQMKQLFGEMYRQFRLDTRDPRSRQERNRSLGKMDRFLKNIFFPYTWITKILDKAARKEADRMIKQGNVRWITIESTKKR